MNLTIELDGRKLVKTDVKEISPDKIIATSYYDDGTEIKQIQTAGNIDIECNKQLEMQADGKTVKIVG